MSEPEKTPVEETEQTTGVDLGSLSDEDLLNLVDSEEDLTTPPEPDPEEEEAGTVDEAETVDESEESDEKEDEKEPDKPEPADEPELTLEQARVLELEAELKHQKSVSGRLGGKMGFIEKQNKELLEQMRTLADSVSQPTSEYVETPETRRAPTPTPTKSRNDVYQSRKAVRNAWTEFMGNHPAVYVERDGASVIDPVMIKALQSSAASINDFSESGDCIDAENGVNSILSEAWERTELGRAIERREEVERRSADQSAALKKKKKAQASASVTARHSAPSRRVTSLRQVNDKDLATAIDSRQGLD